MKSLMQKSGAKVCTLVSCMGRRMEGPFNYANSVTAGFDTATNTLNVYGSGSTTQPIDSFHLGGAYSAADFTASGTTVVFTAHSGS